MRDDFDFFRISDALQYQPLYHFVAEQHLINQHLYKSRKQSSEVARIASLGISFQDPLVPSITPTSAILSTIHTTSPNTYIPTYTLVLSLLPVSPFLPSSSSSSTYTMA
jgi:hypothetical protein